MEKLNFQTKVIVATAIALTAVDLAARAFLTQRTVYVRSGDVVTAREFRLVDESGSLRAHLYTDENSEPGLVLYDREGTRRAQFDTFEQIPSVMLFQPDGVQSSYYGMDTQGRGIFSLYDSTGNIPEMSMSLSNETPSNAPISSGVTSFYRVR